jgi:hypothetical protein
MLCANGVEPSYQPAPRPACTHTVLQPIADITSSSTHNKTHALSNEAFNEIVSRPCHYCGKQSDPPRHHNGLDRLDSSVRVYTQSSCVSCCGDCNVLKYTHTEEFFLSHARAVAMHSLGVESWPGDVDEGCDEGDEGEEQEAVGGGRDRAEPEQAAGGPSGLAALPLAPPADASSEPEATTTEGKKAEAPNPFAGFAFGA